MALSECIEINMYENGKIVDVDFAANNFAAPFCVLVDAEHSSDTRSDLTTRTLCMYWNTK